ncbi:zinc finger transcriptional activator [Emydomyces testavorans]|uniref:Zinc finger transcriptional activator n=1 Tax=Emydomyces testavorans TaxID=2070801 RepID=A0AAF0DM32_9EURO|nr:zinc finger transcriptional activator [Emydomyces testavorans]
MLTIASRHMKLSGNGAISRAYSIHEKLWSYLRGMIERLIWGQEKFGSSGLPSARPRQFNLTMSVFGQQSKLNGNLRSLGTVEALLLLTDWHPRALHFPPGDDENTLLDTDPQLLNRLNGTKEDEHDAEHKDHSGSPEGRLAFYKWLEPVWRSDRMSWMLLSTAQALAFELGVFDQKSEHKCSSEPSSEHVRKRRVRRLILVYVSQSSGRLGIPSMLPLPQWSQNTEPLCTENSKARESKEEFAIDLMQDCWLDISKIMYNSNQVLFPNKEYTTNLIKTGQYRDRIAEFIPSLNEFKQKFDRLPMSQNMRHILTIEYEYTRLYVNCLALQAVVDRWTTISNETASNLDQNQTNGTNPGPHSSSGTVPLRVLMEQYEVNEPYIQEVVDASRRILQTVLEGLVPGNRLKHAPVRTFFRVLSGMIFILKTFTLGAKEDDVRVSLELQDRTIESLRTCIVDDVHLSVTIADLLQLLTSNIRTRFLRFAPFDRLDCSSRERTPFTASRQQSPQPREQGHNDFRWQANAVGQGAGNFHFDSNNHNSSAPTTTNDPLASIPAQPINSSNINVSFMPPPPSVFYNYYDHSTSPKMEVDDSTIAPQAISTSGAVSNSNTMSDWFALPLDQFFNSSTAGVDQGLGGTGPMVGEFDMLEVLLKDQYTDGGAGGGAGGGVAGGGSGSNSTALPSQFL